VRRHDLDLTSLICGVVFLLVAGTHLVAASTDERVELGWLFPVLLVGLGVAGLAGALRSSGRPDDPAPVEDGTATG
jgi:hypothetical protein